jgi:site-specific recombinase XerD
MALRIYIRNHSPKCLTRIQERVDAGEIKPLSEDDLMEYAFCKCPWWMYGTSDQGISFKPHALKVYSKAAAEAKRKDANKSNDADTGMSLQALTDEFILERTTTGRTKETVDIYERVGKRLIDFCQKEKVSQASKVGPGHITRIRQMWIGDGTMKSTVNYHIGILRMIFTYGVRQGHIKSNPTMSLKPIVKNRLRGADADDEEEGENGRTLPIDEDGDENYRKVLAGVEPLLMGSLVVPGRKFARAKTAAYLNDPARFSLLLETMYETGLRVSDAIHVRATKIDLDDEVASYTTNQIKTGDDVTVFMPLELAERIKALDPLHKGFVFFDGSMPWRRFISDIVWRMVHDLGDAVGVPGLRPHRFRDSFAVNRLNENMPIEQVSQLLGHRRVATTLKYYSPWVTSRHDALRANYLAARKTGDVSKRVSGVIPIPIGSVRLVKPIPRP